LRYIGPLAAGWILTSVAPLSPVFAEAVCEDSRLFFIEPGTELEGLLSKLLLQRRDEPAQRSRSAGFFLQHSQIVIVTQAVGELAVLIRHAVNERRPERLEGLQGIP
jgi:hypothetical protein